MSHRMKHSRHWWVRRSISLEYNSFLFLSPPASGHERKMRDPRSKPRSGTYNKTSLHLEQWDNAPPSSHLHKAFSTRKKRSSHTRSPPRNTVLVYTESKLVHRSFHRDQCWFGKKSGICLSASSVVERKYSSHFVEFVFQFVPQPICHFHYQNCNTAAYKM